MTRRVPQLPRPRTVADAIEAAGQALREHRVEDAERLARDVLKSNGANVDAARLLGYALMQQGRFDEAAEALRQPARRSRSSELEALQARALTKGHRNAEAVAVLRTAITRPRPFALAFVQLAELLDESADAAEAADVLNAGLALYAGEPVLSMGLGYHHLHWGERAAARRCFANVHAAHPTRTDATVALAGVLAQDGEHLTAAALYETALLQAPQDVLSRIALAKCLLEAGRRSAGEAQLRIVVRQDPRLWGLAASAQSSIGNAGRLFLSPSRARAHLSRVP